ncbi:MAG: Lrp/AsnC family transcriptional regulator, partial [Thermoplasmata archaeon]|nr:Lrp/AsnC family transcriptional regulator [Thermoplasmata archaeon]
MAKKSKGAYQSKKDSTKKGKNSKNNTKISNKKDQNNKTTKTSNIPQELKDTSNLILSLGTRAPIDPMDAELIQILLKNGRLSNVEIANMLKTSEATIRRRIQTLKDRGFIRGFTTLLDYKRFGHVIMAHVFIQVKQKYIEKIATTLMNLENSCTVYRVIGDYNLSSVMVFKNIAELQEFLDRFSDSDN